LRRIHIVTDREGFAIRAFLSEPKAGAFLKERRLHHTDTVPLDEEPDPSEGEQPATALHVLARFELVEPISIDKIEDLPEGGLKIGDGVEDNLVNAYAERLNCGHQTVVTIRDHTSWLVDANGTPTTKVVKP